MKITFEPPNQPDVIELIAELDAYQDGLYPPEARYVLDMPALLKPNVLFVVARDDENMAIGCAAIILESEYGELKRMYVRPKTRGQGVAHQLLKELEINAIAHGVIPPKRAASKSRINTSPAFSAGRVSLLKPSYAFALE